MSSTYCRREFQIAVASNKAILPVLIDDKTPLPEELREVQYADLSKGLNDTSAVSSLLNSVYMMEKKLASENGRAETYIDVTQVEKITSPIINNNPDSLVARAVESMEKGKFDEALFLLKQAREKETYNQLSSRFFVFCGACSWTCANALRRGTQPPFNCSPVP